MCSWGDRSSILNRNKMLKPSLICSILVGCNRAVSEPDSREGIDPTLFAAWRAKQGAQFLSCILCRGVDGLLSNLCEVSPSYFWYVYPAKCFFIYSHSARYLPNAFDKSHHSYLQNTPTSISAIWCLAPNV